MSMLLSRQEMTFDFGGARLVASRDRQILGWIVNQFLYGEVTGIQCGHWLYDAPDLDAARFFSRQAVEEFQHVDNFLRILDLLGEPEAEPHRIVRFLATGMMPATFEEHVCLEMALGEGFVLMALYAIIDTIDHEGIREILERAVRQEERHVDFGERRTREALARRPGLRTPLLGLSLVSTWAVRRLGRFMRKRLPEGHPVLAQLPRFVEFAVERSELRLLRMGIAQTPPARMPASHKAAAVALAYGRGLVLAPGRLLPRKRLTETYLRDPSLRARVGIEGEKDVSRPPAA